MLFTVPNFFNFILISKLYRISRTASSIIFKSSVGLNIDDVDFKNDGIRIHRKGGKEVLFILEMKLKVLFFHTLKNVKKQRL